MLEKVYSVTFMEYTNVLQNTVSDKNPDRSKVRYLDVSGYSFLVCESKLDTYRKYGNGYKDVKFVGYMYVD